MNHILHIHTIVCNTRTHLRIQFSTEFHFVCLHYLPYRVLHMLYSILLLAIHNVCCKKCDYHFHEAVHHKVYLLF